MLRPFTFTPVFSLLLCFILLINSNGEENTTSEYCGNLTCGNLVVKYPFWINSTAKNNLPQCGYQGLGLHCFPSGHDDNESRLHLQLGSDNFLAVKNISYTDQTVTLVDFEAIRNQTCPKAKPLSLSDSLLDYNRADLNLTFYFNCTRAPPPASNDSTPIYPIDCLRSGRNTSYVSRRPETNDIEEDSDWSRTCEDKVVAPVIDQEGRDYYDWGSSFGKAMNEGFVLDWRKDQKCFSCEASDGLCGFNQTNEKFCCFCNDGTIQPDQCNKIGGGRSNIQRLKFVIGFVPTAIILLLCIMLLKWKTNYLRLLIRKTKEDMNLEAFLKQYGTVAPKRYSHSDIKRMTMSFKYKIGQGGYGTVYKGKLPDSRLVAVKILKVAKGDEGEEFINEVLSICRTSHVNVVSFLGFCLEGKRRALVYEYMPNGSLEKFIHCKENSTGYNQLGMEKLHQISLGVAQGLHYLHRGCNTRILHFDIKPHNILLDEDFCPKISDFGLAKQCTPKESFVTIADIRGTIGYIAPELVSRHFGGVSYKSDVYSYGMMILEIVGRRKNVNSETSHSSQVYFPQWAYQHLVMDQDLRLKGVVTPEEDELAKKIILVGLWCVQNDPSSRPTMSKVIEMLEGDLEAIPAPPKAFFGSFPTTPQPSFTYPCTTNVSSSS